MTFFSSYLCAKVCFYILLCLFRGGRAYLSSIDPYLPSLKHLKSYAILIGLVSNEKILKNIYPGGQNGLNNYFGHSAPLVRGCWCMGCWCCNCTLKLMGWVGSWCSASSSSTHRNGQSGHRIVVHNCAVASFRVVDLTLPNLYHVNVSDKEQPSEDVWKRRRRNCRALPAPAPARGVRGGGAFVTMMQTTISRSTNLEEQLNCKDTFTVLLYNQTCNRPRHCCYLLWVKLQASGWFVSLKANLN